MDGYAGRGKYDLSDPMALKTGEWRDGIWRIWGKTTKDPLLAKYLNLIQKHNKNTLRYYPGSPVLAAEMLRSSDRLLCYELHPQEIEGLKQTLKKVKNAHVDYRDGPEGILANIPPKERRGGILLDPSYDIKTEYEAIPIDVEKMLQKWETATILIWYPILAAGNHEKLKAGLSKLDIDNQKMVIDEWHWPKMGYGLLGSGMAIVNPVYQGLERVNAAKSRVLITQ